MHTPDLIERLPIAALLPHPTNPRAHSKSQVAAIAASMRRFGWTLPVLIDDGNNVIAGHGRLLAAAELGITEVPAIRLAHLTPDEARAYRIADNQLVLAGDWKDDLLSFEVTALKDSDFDLSLLGFNDIELRKIIGAGVDERAEETPDVEKTVVSSTGDVWLCGDHRLLCGDATSKNDVSNLLNGAKIQYVFTSPPYGIDLEYERGDSLETLNRLVSDAIYAIDAMSCNDAYATMNYADIFRPGDDGFTPMSQTYHKPFTDCGWCLRGNRIWLKPIGRLALSYATSTTMNLREWEYVQTWRKGHGKETLRDHGISIRGVWKSYGDDAVISDWKQADDTTKKAIHPAAFPVLLPVSGIRCYTDADDSVYDPFLGSGTTMIAAEITGRRCYGIEIAPQYVDVAVRRWQQYTGKQATLDGTNATFDEIAEERT